MSKPENPLDVMRRERDEAREALEWYSGICWEGGTVDEFDFQDEMERRGLLVMVEASDEVRDEWDVDNMYVWKWSERAKGGDDGR